jgi:hypothetical protein
MESLNTFSFVIVNHAGKIPVQSTPPIYFHYGVLLSDVYNRFIAGESFFLRKIELFHEEMLEEKTIREYVSQAIEKWEYFKENWKALNAATKDRKA